MAKGSKIKMNVGTSSFVVIFVVVSLATFAVLSLVSANANKRMINKSIEQVDEYYTMNTKAQNKLAEIDTLLQSTYLNTTSKENYFNELNQLLSLQDDLYTYTIEGSSQNLVVTLQIKYPNPGETFYAIMGWSKESKEEWTPKNNTNLLKAEDMYGDTGITNISN